MKLDTQAISYAIRMAREEVNTTNATNSLTRNVGIDIAMRHLSALLPAKDRTAFINSTEVKLR